VLQLHRHLWLEYDCAISTAQLLSSCNRWYCFFLSIYGVGGEAVAAAAAAATSSDAGATAFQEGIAYSSAKHVF
jgi:hypothetical protein